MCGRFYIASEDHSEELRALVEELNHGVQPEKLKTRGEIYPSDVVPVRVTADPESRETSVIAAQWGFHLSGKAQLIINARSETIDTKPLFKNAERCVIPATRYYEWETVTQGDTLAEGEPVQLSLLGIAPPKALATSTRQKPAKEKRAIAPLSSVRIFYMAGLIRREAGSDIPVFTILTREAAPELSYIHDRMPYILKQDQAPEWLINGVLPDVADTFKYKAEPAGASQ